jgi:hypothetical protein
MSRSLISALVLLAALLVLFILVPGVLLVLFAGALLAVALRALAVPIADRLGIGEGWGVMIVSLLALVLLGLAFWFASDALSAQADSFRQQLPGLVDSVQERLSRYGWGRWLIEQVDPRRLIPSGDTAGTAATYAVSGLGGLLGGLGDVVLILLLGLYLASAPGPYRKAATSLLAPAARPRFLALLDEAGQSLRGWLLGQLFAMTVTGVFIGSGLWALGVPLAGLLGLIAAIFAFIPLYRPADLGGAGAAGGAGPGSVAGALGDRALRDLVHGRGQPAHADGAEPDRTSAAGLSAGRAGTDGIGLRADRRGAGRPLRRAGAGGGEGRLRRRLGGGRGARQAARARRQGRLRRRAQRDAAPGRIQAAS